MALFAAYADVKETEAGTASVSAEDAWLTNSSFKIDVTPFQSSELQQLHPKHYKTTSGASGSEQSETDEASNDKRAKKRKKNKKKSKKSLKKQKRAKHDDSPSLPTEDPEDFTIDKKRVMEYKYANTIARPSAPRYKVYKYLGLPRERKVKKFKRYWQVILDKHVNESASDDGKLTKYNVDASGGRGNTDDFVLLEEQEMSRQTATYNRELQIDTHNIDMWMKYVQFQDAIFNFEKSFRKGSIAKGQRVTAERKLAILDRALQHNPDCETLLRMRLEIAVGVFPADELQTQLGGLVDRDSRNIILWQGYIEATQCSMSHCTAPAVINLYIKCLHTLHTIRRKDLFHGAMHEENILRMLYQCGLFLRQAGLFEQLWTLLRKYLELNLTSHPTDPFASTIGSDRQLVDLEDTVLKSQLPIHELWLRIEKLREASHWLPVSMSCEDPQRLVFTEDVSELIHPITIPGNILRLTITILTLLKIPLLPARHTTMKEFGIDYVPWSLDSVETLLPVFYNLYPMDDRIGNNLLDFAQKLAVGPQYLKTLPGQEEYLQFILTVMQSCINCLTGNDQIAIAIWYFRFVRLLWSLEKRNLFKVQATFKKQVKSKMKTLLKKHATDVILFKEYALVELETSVDSAVNVLKPAITVLPSIFDNTTKNTQGGAFAALRTFMELHVFPHKFVDDEVKHKCLRYVVTVIFEELTLEEVPLEAPQHLLNRAKEKFAEITEEVLKTGPAEEVDHFLPDFTTDWLIINALWLYLTGGSSGITNVRIFLENILLQWNEDACKDKHQTKMAARAYRTEILYEFLVALLFKVCVDLPGSGMYPTLDKYLHLGIEKFPNNLFLLATLAKVQSFHANYGQPWWKIQSLLLKTGHALSTLFAVLIANQRIAQLDAESESEVITRDAVRNRMLNLFKRITRSDMCTRRCGLVWRLYLQFLHAYFEPKVGRDAYYLAVEECPWLKSLYIDAAIYIPEDLAQIQDLIIEKQLRIHVTPEELDVLRS